MTMLPDDRSRHANRKQRFKEYEEPLTHEEEVAGADDGDLVPELARLRTEESPGPFFVAAVMRDVESAPRSAWSRVKEWSSGLRLHPRRVLVAVPIGMACASLWFMVVSAERQVKRVEEGFSSQPVAADVRHGERRQR